MLSVPSLATLALSRASILEVVRSMSEDELLSFVSRATPPFLEKLHKEFGYGHGDCSCTITRPPCPCGKPECKKDGDCLRKEHRTALDKCERLLGRIEREKNTAKVLALYRELDEAETQAYAVGQKLWERGLLHAIRPCHHSHYTGYLLPPAVADLIVARLWPEEYAEPPRPYFRPQATITLQNGRVGRMIDRHERGEGLRHPWDEDENDEGEEANMERVGTRCPKCHGPTKIDNEPGVAVREQDAECLKCHWFGLVRELVGRLRNGADGKFWKLTLKQTAGPAKKAKEAA